MFMGPFDADALWDDSGINGVWRWLHRVWELAQPAPNASKGDSPDAAVTETVSRALHKTIRKLTEDLEGLRFNTCISALMELTNLLQKQRDGLDGSPFWAETIDTVLVLMAPLTPFITEELWHRRGKAGSIHQQSWPAFDPAFTQETTVKIIVQVNGKIRETLDMAKGTSQGDVEAQARSRAAVSRWLEDKPVRKVVFVPDRLLNFVV